jgi:hypothetical protein
MVNAKIIIENKEIKNKEIKNNEVENKLNELLLKIHFIKNNYKMINSLFNNHNDNDILINNINNCLKLIDKNIIQNGSLQRLNKYS